MNKTDKNNNIEIKLRASDLARALGFANSVIEKRNIVVELNNIKIMAIDGRLEIGATDMDLYLNQNIPCEVISEGVTTISAKTIFDIVRKMSDEEIVLKQIANEDKLEIQGKNCRFELLTLDATQFPKMDDAEFDSNLSINCSDLTRIIEYTSFAMSSEETRYNLNGLYLHVNDKKLTAAATDGHRLSVAKTSLETKANDFGVIIPRKAVSELLKIVRDSKNSDSNMNISLASNKIKFQKEDIILISKLVDGVFPDYSGFIPNENESKLVVNREILAKAIDRVAAVTIDKFRAVKLFIDDKLKIAASGEAKGIGNEYLDFSEKKDKYCQYSGSKIDIGFNPRYISDVLESLKENQVEIYLKDGFSPVLIKTPENSEDSFVVMPVKV